ncbi:MAG: hydroxysqualene dehydroxylase HpnE [Candidatus Dormibacteraceae bacterium]
MRVVVVGAGLAGLACARALQQAGHEVTIFERSRLIGGKATSFQAGEDEVDNGQHVFLGCFTAWRGLVEEVGMGGALHLPPRFEAVLLDPRGGRAHLRTWPLPPPLHLAPALLAHRLLGLGGRLRVAGAMGRAGRPAGPGETFDRWLRRQGQGPRERAAFWEPFLVPSLNAPLDQVDAESGLFVLRRAFLAGAGACRIGWSRVPLGRIAEAMAKGVEVRVRRAVHGIAFDEHGVRGVRTAAGEQAADAVVLAVPPEAARRLLPAAAGVPGMEEIRSQPIVDVHLWYDAERLELPWGLDFAALVGSPVQWVFRKRPGYLCCSLSAASELVALPEPQLVERCHAELARVLPALRELRPRRGRATRDPAATFVPTPGLRRPGPETEVRGLYLAGAWTDTGWPATMESAVRSGGIAARALLRAGALAPARPRPVPQVVPA